MTEKNFDTYIDFGSSKIRIGVFNKDLPEKKFFSEKKCLSNFNLNYFDLNDSKKVIEKLIQYSEKEVGCHLKNINLMIDTPDLFSIDLSIKKNLEGKRVSIDDIKYLLQDARQLIQKNNFDKKIIHIIIEKFIFDKKIFYSIPTENIQCNYLILEIKFFCFSNLIIEQLNNNFKENHIAINNILCSSYAKSSNYHQLFDKYDKKVFLDIGYKKSCLTIFDKNRMIFFNTIPLGGNHITKDISQVLKISEDDSEDIKRSLNQSESIFSNESNDEFISNLETKKKLQEKIPLDLLKKVIHARIDEILNLSFRNIDFSSLLGEKKNCILVFTGEGSKILDKNFIYLENKFNFFSEMNFFEESTDTICQSGYNFSKKNNYHEVNVISKKPKKYGFFEKLFHLFG
jgi:cell division protein FtsA